MRWFVRRRPVRPDAPHPDEPRPVPQPELPRDRTALTVGSADETEIRNLAMAVVLMWGPSRALSPVDRLRTFVAGLDQQTAEVMVADARAAAQLAEAHVYDHSDYTGKRIAFAPKEDVVALVRGRFPWVDEDNLSHSYSQSCYYAWHG